MIVGVVGAGTMGAGIAQVCLQAGHEVLLYDIDDAAIGRGRERVEAGLERGVARGRVPADDAAAARARLRNAHTLDAVAAEADLVIEAALEDIELKRTIFRALDGLARPDAILATNTSALSVGEIAAVTSRPGRVVGLHFFNPAPAMALVEVVAADATAAETVDRAVAFCRGLGKTPVVCADSPGFIVNRVIRPFTLEALRFVDAGEAAIEDVDEAMEAAGYPMGPFRLMDLVGIDVNLAVARSLYAAFDEAPRFRPSPLQSAMVEAGRLGRKTGIGFYRYAADGALGIADLPTTYAPAHPKSGGAAPAARITARIELAIINEAYHAVDEQVAEPPDIDRAMRLGAGHPKGPFERAGDLGLRVVVEGLARLARSHEPDAAGRFTPAEGLWRIATI